MNLEEAKEKFISSWGALGTNWGINRTMAQIHALLLVSPKAMSADDIMEELKISRGNANMNIRELIEWQLVSKEHVPGERREYFVAEKDIYKVFVRIIKERRRRELEPMMQVLTDLKQVKEDKKSEEYRQFVKTINDINDFTQRTDKALNTMVKSDENWFLQTFIKLMN